MERVYEVENSKKAELKKILEKDPYAEGSFARVGYKMRDGGSLGMDSEKTYVYLNASDDFVKKADEILKDLGKSLDKDAAVKVIEAIKSEEDGAAAGVGAIFG